MRLRPPSEVRARAGGERVLAWLPSGSSSLLATDMALVLPEGMEPARIPWDLVLRAQWSENALDVTAQTGPGGRPVLLHVPVTGDVGTLAGVVRERVNASIVIQDHVSLTASAGARVVARRVPGSTDLRWSVVFDPGLDPSDPALRAAADAALAELRATLGV
ncbi:MAG: hypothetical protein AB7O74_11650 [Candidatus Nanopelagicales bacterium]